MAQACGICTSDRAATINSHLAAGRSASWIEREMKRLEKPTKAETVRRHLTNCLNGNPKAGPIRERANGQSVSDEDFAAAVRAEAQKLLAEGKLSVRTEHGLSAQALIDRRAEKQADRRLMLEMASLLAGTRSLQGPPEDLIEGEWREVDDDEDQTLAPLALVAGE